MDRRKQPVMVLLTKSEIAAILAASCALAAVTLESPTKRQEEFRAILNEVIGKLMPHVFEGGSHAGRDF
jgi:hypothetical protein